jgi:uncharacterized membrane protein
MLRQKSIRKPNTAMLVKVGLLSSITIVMGTTGVGFIPIQPFKLTIMHIPVIIGAILEGPLAGALIGMIFGLFSIYQNLMVPGITSFAFYNPLVSVLPRILIGIVSYYMYKVFSRFNEGAGVAVGAALGSLTNTIGVLGMIFVIYLQRYVSARGTTAKAIYTAGAMNGAIEAVLATLIVLPIVFAVNKIRRK